MSRYLYRGRHRPGMFSLICRNGHLILPVGSTWCERCS